MKLRFISPDIHGLLDYAAAAGLIILPLLLGLQNESMLVFTFSLVAGLGLILYSLLTDYQFGLSNFFSYKVHLLLDALASVAFIVLAFLHQGSSLSFWYCLAMAGGVMVVILFSELEFHSTANS